MQEQQRIRLKIPSNYIYISPIRAFVKQLAQRLGFTQIRVEDIELTVDELCNNAIEHGSRGINSDFLLVLTLNDDCLEILVRDKGKDEEEANWLQSGRLEEVERQMSPKGERGHGIFLARILSDRIEMNSNAHGGTDVRIVFLREFSSAEAGEG
ncbi:TPA: ATP-binding protein [Candidatus Poribacteria bacterium]|nr:ATP-binding protein [Candidatus Poribacteria bacterium]